VHNADKRHASPSLYSHIRRSYCGRLDPFFIHRLPLYAFLGGHSWNSVDLTQKHTKLLSEPVGPPLLLLAFLHKQGLCLRRMTWVEFVPLLGSPRPAGCVTCSFWDWYSVENNTGSIQYSVNTLFYAKSVCQDL